MKLQVASAIINLSLSKSIETFFASTLTILNSFEKLPMARLYLYLLFINAITQLIRL